MEDKNLLKFFCCKDVKTMLCIFKELKTAEYKVPIAAGFLLANTQIDYFKDYVRRNLKKAMLYLLDINYLAVLEKILLNELITEGNIDICMHLVLDAKNKEAYKMLVIYKNKHSW